MPLEPIKTRETSTSIGKLCLGGDWACSHGDFGGLRWVAQQLVDYVPEPLHCEVQALACACASDPDQATALWDTLKDRLYREARR